MVEGQGIPEEFVTDSMNKKELLSKEVSRSELSFKEFNLSVTAGIHKW